MLVGVIILLVQAIFSSGPTPDPLDEPRVEEEHTPAEEVITLLAEGPVTVSVRQLSDNQVIFSGALAAGDRQSVTMRGPVRIAYTQAENLQIQRASGERFRFPDTGSGYSTIR